MLIKLLKLIHRLVCYLPATSSIFLSLFSVQAYLRKANVLVSMCEHTKALKAVQEAELHDEGNKNTAEIKQLEYKIQMALYKQRGEETQEETLERAMRDSEVAVSDFCLVY